MDTNCVIILFSVVGGVCVIGSACLGLCCDNAPNRVRPAVNTLVIPRELYDSYIKPPDYSEISQPPSYVESQPNL